MKVEVMVGVINANWRVLSKLGSHVIINDSEVYCYDKNYNKVILDYSTLKRIYKEAL